MVVESVILTLLVSQTIGRAASLSCFECSSRRDEDCAANPRQENYEKPCLDLRSAASSRAAGNPRYLEENKELACSKVVASNETYVEVRRGCAVQDYTCDQWGEEWAQEKQLRLVSCSLCESQLCNSAPGLGVHLMSMLCCCFLASTRLF